MKGIAPYLACSLALLTGTCGAAGDTTSVKERHLVFMIGAGATWHPLEVGVPRHLNTRVTRVGPSVMGRIMWHPEHLLRVGIESGWTSLYSYSIEGPGPGGSVAVSGVPLLLQWSMLVTPRLEAYAGYGTYRLTSALDHLGSVRSSFYSQGYAAALAYRWPIARNTDLAVELKWMNAFVTRHHLLALQWRFDWKFLTW